MYIGILVTYPLFLSDFKETYIFRNIFEKYLDIKINENPSSEIQAVACGLIQKRADGQTDMTKLIFAFGNFAIESKQEV